MTYFVIYQSDDGLRVNQLGASELLERVGDGCYGPEPKFNMLMPRVTDTSEWPVGTLLIIKGELVVPRAVQVVAKWEL